MQFRFVAGGTSPRVDPADDVPEAVTLYRQLLAHQPDHSVTIVALGAYTNLAALLAAPGGRALVTEKVKRLAIMDGLDGIGTRVGESLCTKVPADHPMRIVYEDLFGCGAVGDVCVHLADQQALNRRIEQLITADAHPA